MGHNIGENIRIRRQQLHMSQDELAKRLGYAGRSSITKIEKAVNGMPQDKLTELARALNTTEVYLMGLVDDPNWRMPKENFSLSDSERRMVEKYREADEEKRKLVDYLLG